ncbi:hypothetical protein JYG23_09220 [Sedimentibacter sp. zth1]|uniref:hypothetical protein n=1 Tax=Sedimentibacter sp. zth1 TaxID=2816908 RepID=UPI001A9129B4|nr:hypothetical protein [Sedimentibacter sp. zth1]QSX04880.1 hypothetical protein JYG23_09220 [Sedimentibacter sp. zth1]
MNNKKNICIGIILIILVIVIVFLGFKIRNLKNDFTTIKTEHNNLKVECENTDSRLQECLSKLSEKERSYCTVDETYVNIISSLLSRFDENELKDIYLEGSNYSLKLYEIDKEFNRIGDEIKISELNDIQLDYNNFAIVVGRQINVLYNLLMLKVDSSYTSRIEEPWIEVLDYSGYEEMPSAGGPGGEGMSYFFIDVKSNTDINIKLNAQLAKVLGFDKKEFKIKIK